MHVKKSDVAKSDVLWWAHTGAVCQALVMSVPLPLLSPLWTSALVSTDLCLTKLTSTDFESISAAADNSDDELPWGGSSSMWCSSC